MSWLARLRELQTSLRGSAKGAGSPSGTSGTPPPAPFWTREEEARVRAACLRLGFEPEEVRLVLAACREHADAREAWLERAGEVLRLPDWRGTP